jgi:hypothetical protein
VTVASSIKAIEDIGKIDAVSQQSRDLYQLIGDCGDEYRR